MIDPVLIEGIRRAIRMSHDLSPMFPERYDTLAL
jgi:hypothetical protein